MNKINKQYSISIDLAAKYLYQSVSEYKTFLFDDYLPFIEQYVFDHEFGGFKCNTPYSGRNISTDKRTWYDARGVWVYSYLYVNLDKDIRYSHNVEKTVELLLNIINEENKLWLCFYVLKG